MKRGFILMGGLLLLSIFIAGVQAASVSSIDDEFRKIANYAAEYETGNINYAKLLIYTSSIKESMNEILGTTSKEMGGILKQEQIKIILGESKEETKWVWLEGEEREIKLEEAVPVWKKIIFDGRKIQIRLNAWPSIFSRRNFEKEENEAEENKKFIDLEGKLIYRLNFEITFKKPDEQLNIQGRINDIQALAQSFNSNPSPENAETLAKESVNAERAFESYFRQSGENCEAMMGNIFGTENKRQTQNLLVNEISFCEGENYEVIARLEMCEECEWNWINLDFWVEGRGLGFKIKEEANAFSPESFKGMNNAGFEEEVKKIMGEIKQLCESKEIGRIMSAKNKLWAVNDAWNQKSNDVWKEIDEIFKSQTDSMTEKQRREFDQNYGWIKQEQEKRQKVKELQKSNYEARKQFYFELFSGYDKKGYSFSQIEFQKRLVEEFKEKGEEICNNNQDDNGNEAIDCADEQCGGKVCGRGENIIWDGNEMRKEEADFYCIEKQCKAREVVQEKVRNVSIICQELPAVECAEGSKVIFSEYDNETNCPTETMCLEEKYSCEVNEDCKQPACGIAECIENKCAVTALTECKELECIAGDEKMCELDGKIVGICNEGFWEEIGMCEEEPEVREKIVVGNECTSASDCGSENVCNNGVCQVLPEVIIIEPEITQPEETEEAQTGEEILAEENSQNNNENLQGEADEGLISSGAESSTNEQESEVSSSAENSGATANAIFKFVGALFSKIKITGAAIIGFGIEEEKEEPAPAQETTQETTSETTQETIPAVQSTPEETGEIEDNQQPIESLEGQEPEQNREQEEDREEEQERENERRMEENRERCKSECKRPCVEKCIRTGCGEELNCNVDEMQKKCERSCEADENCVEKCTQGGDWWKEFENKNENKEEKGVFQVGGNCRTGQGKTEGFIWFGGWGVPFEQVQPLKNKYYSGGQSEWCKNDFENLKMQRQEFEKGFNQEFAAWFFEKYLANSAENWEQVVSGIFEIYWKDVDNSREMAYRMQCLEMNELSGINLINIKYDTEYGSLEFWEEIKNVKLPGMDKEVQVISPYMKAWVFPSKEFIVYEMKKSMKNHEFPGSPEEKAERKNEEGPTAEEREMIKQDKKFMEKIKKITERYGGNLDVSIRFVEHETNDIAFNLYAQVNENEIIKMKPMLLEEMPSEDVKIEIDFKLVYEFIYDMEKEIRGEMTESPPWDRRIRPIQKIKEITQGVKSYFKIREIINSAKISPVESEKEVRDLIKEFMSMMKEGGENAGRQNKIEGEDKGIEENVWESKETITGETILI